METLQLIAGIIGLSANIPLLIGIYRSKPEQNDTQKIEQSFATFALWAALDSIAAVSTILEHGNFLLPLGYSLGAAAVASLLYIKKQFSWSWIEWVATGLVIICVFVWIFNENKTATIASSLAVVFAAIPQIIDTFRKPETTPTGIYCIFLFANVLSLYGGKSWTIEERFYSGCVVFLTTLLIVLSVRKTKKADA